MNRLYGGIVQIHHDKIRALSRIEASETPAQSKTLRATESSHPEGRVGVQRFKSLRPDALLEDGGSHFLEHVHDVIAGNTVGAEGQWNTGLANFRNS